MTDKHQVARVLGEIARYLELSEPNRFKSLAFERAARKVEEIGDDLDRLVETGKLYDTPGIGKGTGQAIEEIVRTGSCAYLEELRQRYPPEIFELLRVSGLGIKKIGALFDELGIASIEALEEACRAGRLAALRGFGAKSQEKILAGIARARQREPRFLLPIALDAAELLRQGLLELDPIDAVEVAGGVRRRLEIVGNLDLVIVTRDPPAAIEAIVASALLENLEPNDASSVRGLFRNEIEARLHFAMPDDLGATFLRATGSAEFVEGFTARALRSGIEMRAGVLYRNARHVKAKTEHAAFEAAGIAFVEPELRESAGALAAPPPKRLVRRADLKGTFHVHTTYSDGRNSLAEMLEAARAQKFAYVGISDHSKSAAYAGGLNEDRLRQQEAEMERLRPAFAGMRIFRGTEADILADGSIDYGLDTLARFDFVIASVHSRFGLSPDEMTERMLRALDNPYVTFLGHLTGRLLLSRDGYTADFNRIFEKAAARGVMIEINGNPNRLDIDWRHIRRARDLGVRFSIHPDAHSIVNLGHVLNGTWVARKGGLSPKEIFNTCPLDEVEAHFASRKRRAGTS
ncbi:MAG TPA: PHP domain-containing protein [Thermoanaerobaculia bacterium]|nr:PHP domain-containing protein [Thermoanaerobaculia bacterium]